MITKHSHIWQPKLRARKRKRQQKAVLAARRSIDYPMGYRLLKLGLGLPIRSDFK